MLKLKKHSNFKYRPISLFITSDVLACFRGSLLVVSRMRFGLWNSQKEMTFARFRAHEPWLIYLRASSVMTMTGVLIFPPPLTVDANTVML